MDRYGDITGPTASTSTRLVTGILGEINTDR